MSFCSTSATVYIFCVCARRTNPSKCSPSALISYDESEFRHHCPLLTKFSGLSSLKLFRVDETVEFCHSMSGKKSEFFGCPFCRYNSCVVWNHEIYGVSLLVGCLINKSVSCHIWSNPCSARALQWEPLGL